MSSIVSRCWPRPCFQYAHANIWHHQSHSSTELEDVKFVAEVCFFLVCFDIVSLTEGFSLVPWCHLGPVRAYRKNMDVESTIPT
jgi:hypothetical protein